MPPVIAIAAPLIASVTVASVMTGAMVVGAGLTVASKITGSKLLGKIGMGLSIAGGVGSIGTSMAGIGSSTLGELGGTALGEIGGGAAGIETAASSVMSAETLGIGGAAESGAGALGNASKAMGTLNKGAKAAQASDSLFSPESDSYKKFEMASNIIGGIAEGSDDEANRKQAMKLQNDQQAFQREQRDYRAENLNAYTERAAQPGIRRVNTPPLRAPQPLARIN